MTKNADLMYLNTADEERARELHHRYREQLRARRARRGAALAQQNEGRMIVLFSGDMNIA